MALLPKVKLKTLVSFPAAAYSGVGVAVRKENGKFFFDQNFADFAPPVGSIPDAANQNALLWNKATGSYVLAPVSLFGGGGGVPEAPNDGTSYGRLNVAWSKVLALAGDTLTGPLILAANPLVPLGAATKQYVDAHVGGGVLNILDYGGVGDGATANDAAFNAAYAALGSHGGCIYFPSSFGIGKYAFSSAVSKILPNAQFNLTLLGDGSNGSILFWPNAAGGMTFTRSSNKNTFHARGLSIQTGVASGGTGLLLTSVLPFVAREPWSDIYDVEICGDDVTGAFSHYWSTALRVHCWSQVNFTSLNTFGSNAGTGNGVIVEGDTGSSNYGVLYNFQSSSMSFHDVHFLYGDFVQGVTLNQINMNGQVGTAGIRVSGTGVLTLLSVINSQIDTGGDQLQVLSPISLLYVGFSAFNIKANNANGIFLASGTNSFNIIGNRIAVQGTPTGTNGVTVFGSSLNGVISGNVIAGCALGVNLAAGSSAVKLYGNIYTGAGAPFVNNGTSVAPGTVGP